MICTMEGRIGRECKCILLCSWKSDIALYVGSHEYNALLRVFAQKIFFLDKNEHRKKAFASIYAFDKPKR